MLNYFELCPTISSREQVECTSRYEMAHAEVFHRRFTQIMYSLFFTINYVRSMMMSRREAMPYRLGSQNGLSVRTSMCIPRQTISNTAPIHVALSSESIIRSRGPSLPPLFQALFVEELPSMAASRDVSVGMSIDAPPRTQRIGMGAQGSILNALLCDRYSILIQVDLLVLAETHAIHRCLLPIVITS